MSSQQPILVYPNTATTTTTARQPSSHSNGSFGTVFIVLAVIVVVSVIACCLGRLCNRRSSSNLHQKAKQNHTNSWPKGSVQNHHNIHGREGDIEFGFDKGVPNAKPFGNGGEAKGHRPAPGNGGIYNGEGPRFGGGEGENKAGQFSAA